MLAFCFFSVNEPLKTMKWCFVFEFTPNTVALTFTHRIKLNFPFWLNFKRNLWERLILLDNSMTENTQIVCQIDKKSSQCAAVVWYKPQMTVIHFILLQLFTIRFHTYSNSILICPWHVIIKNQLKCLWFIHICFFANTKLNLLSTMQIFSFRFVKFIVRVP